MVEHQFVHDDEILVLRPAGALSKSDFDRLKPLVDEKIADGKLKALMIVVKSFPGWKDFDSLRSHFEFVSEHHRKLSRVAIVTDGAFLSMVPSLVDHFLHAEVEHFGFDDERRAVEWLLAAKPIKTDG